MGSRNLKTGLTSQQTEFSLTLRADKERIGWKAYKHSYPSCKSVGAAEVGASKLLRNPKVKAFIQKLDERDLAKYDVTIDNINREKSAIAFFDLRKMFNEDGSLKHPHELDDATVAAISSIEVEAKATGKGENREFLIVSKVKFHNKVQVLDQLSRQLGQYERDNEQKGGTMAELIKGVDGQTRGLPPPEDDEE